MTGKEMILVSLELEDCVVACVGRLLLTWPQMSGLDKELVIA